MSEFLQLVEEWSRNLRVQARHRWTLTPLAEAKEWDASCADVPDAAGSRYSYLRATKIDAYTIHIASRETHIKNVLDIPGLVAPAGFSPLGFA